MTFAAPESVGGDAKDAPVCLGGRRSETRYIRWVIFRQRVSAGS